MVETFGGWLSESLHESLGERSGKCCAIGWVRCWIQPFILGKLGEREHALGVVGDGLQEVGWEVVSEHSSSIIQASFKYDSKELEFVAASES